MRRPDHLGRVCRKLPSCPVGLIGSGAEISLGQMESMELPASDTAPSPSGKSGETRDHFFFLFAPRNQTPKLQENLPDTTPKTSNSQLPTRGTPPDAPWVSGHHRGGAGQRLRQGGRRGGAGRAERGERRDGQLTFFTEVVEVQYSQPC